MSGVATAGVFSAGLNAYSSQQAADQQENALRGALQYQKPYRKAGRSALNTLSGLFGEAPTQVERNEWAGAVKEGLRPQLKQIKATGGTKADRQKLLQEAVKTDYEKRAAQRLQGTNYGFLNQRFGNEQFVQDPGYQFRLNEGANVLQNSLAARGGLFSGAAGKALTQYGQNFGANEYQNAYNRYTGDQANMFNRAAAMAGLGQQSVQSSMPYRAEIGNVQAANTKAQFSAMGDAAGSGGSYWASKMNQPSTDTQNRL